MNESRRFQIHWMLWSAAGLAVGLIAALALGAPLEAILGAMLVTPALTAIVGAFFGTSQWVLLRRRVSNARWWIPASAAGLGLGLTAGVVLVEQVGRLITGGQVSLGTVDVATRAGSIAVVGLVSGVFLGAAQWLVLRSLSPAARSWFWTTTLSLGAAFLAGSLAADLLFGGLMAPVGFIAFVVVTGLLAGALTSRPLARLQV